MREPHLAGERPAKKGFVDDFIDPIMVDPRLNANPRVDEAHHRVPPAGFKYLVTEMVCWAAGGPQKYTGRSMYESHKDMKITSGEWDAFMDDFSRRWTSWSSARSTELKARKHARRHRRGARSGRNRLTPQRLREWCL